MKDTEYKTQQTLAQTSLLKDENEIFNGAEGNGHYIIDGECRHSEHIIASCDSINNLWNPIQRDALVYFEKYSIKGWNQDKDRYYPTGNLLSSQINCLNHLFAIRKDATAVLELIKPLGEKAGVHFDTVLPSIIDRSEPYFDENKKVHCNSNFISFEFTCENKAMLDEVSNTRGAKCTSIDAFVYAKAGDEYWLVPIEWKYVEAYDQNDTAYIFDRYGKFVNEQSRIKEWSDMFRNEPFNELGRQTLFMEQLIKNHPLVGISRYKTHLKADNFLHIVVVPNGNVDFRKDADLFRSLLRDNAQKLFQVIDPMELMQPLSDNQNYEELLDYLKKRYHR